MNQKTVLQTLSRFYAAKASTYYITRIGLFGSTARNQHNHTSDVDVVVELSKPDLLALVGIKQELEEMLHCPVDIVRYREQMNPFLKQRIEQEAIYV